MKDHFIVSLCCPIPRKGFGKSERRCEDEIAQMEGYLRICKGDIAVFPEGYLPSYRAEEVSALAKKYRCYIIAGSEDQGEHKSLYTLVFSPDEGLIYSHRKTALTDGDRSNGALPGEEISALDTPFGKIGTVLCYELHFPEVARIQCIEGARILFNTIGTGMWHEQQFDEWTSIAKARAIENRCFVVGCTHCCDPIPLVFAYDPHGRTLLLKKNEEGIFDVAIDMSKIDERDYFKDRNPKAYTKICEEGNL